MITHALIRRAATAALATVFLNSTLSAQAANDPLLGVETYIQKAMAEWGVAGLAVGVVHGDSLVFARGFGVRRLGQAAPVTPHTVFAIGSNTKLFTGVLAAMLVDDGRMAWSDRVTKYLPWFQLSDPWVTREMTLVDALSHRSGLGQRGDMVAYGSPLSRTEVLKRFRYLAPSSSFRSEFGYSNAMIVAAGEAEAAAAGVSWDQLVERRVFQPLGMHESATRLRDLARYKDVATPHHNEGGQLQAVPWRNIDNVGPAGSITSNVVDMAKWLRLLLNGGRMQERRLVSRANFDVVTSPHTIIPFSPDTLRPSVHFLAYGLGVMMHDYRGVKVLTHTGGIDGMLSDVTWVPQRRLGIVVLTNTDGHNALFTAISRWILDRYLGAPPVDWGAVHLAAMERAEATIRHLSAKADSSRPTNAPPSVRMQCYDGQYRSDLYGIIRVAGSPNLRLTLESGLSGRLTHWAHDTFKLEWDVPGSTLLPAFVTFTVDPVGRVEALEIRDDLLAPPGTRVWDRDRFVRLQEP